ncbi:MAG: hypothetical protein R3B60_01220 [Candidatus Paceibacterota bacterium]
MNKLTLNRKKILFSALALVTLFLPSLIFASDVNDGGVLSSISSGLEKVLWLFVNAVFGFLVWVAGTLLNLAVTTFVVGFADLYNNSGLGFAVDRLWEVVRDIFNLTFIFGLVYIGFKMILNAGDTDARRMLAYIIMAALLVNFSLFFTKFIVDFSNVAATQVAQAFDHSNPTGTYEVSDGFANVLGLSSIWDDKTLSNFTTNQVGSGFTYVFGTMITFVVMAFVFFAGAFLLIIRFVVLNIYMILSPIMFLGWVFPSMANYSRDYWKGFLGRAFFAPAYLLMLYLAFYILTNFQNASNISMAEIYAKGNATSNEIANVIAMFLVTCVFLVAAVVVANRMGADGASGVINVGRNLAGRARRATQRGAGNIVFGITYPARAGIRTAVNASGAHSERKLNELQTRSGVLGTASRWNWVDKTIRGGAEKQKNAELGTGTTNQREREYKQSTQARANQTRGEQERKDKFEENNKILTDHTKSSSSLSDALEELGKTIKQMTGIEKERLGFDKLNTQNVAVHLSDDDITNLEKTGKFSSQQIQDIKNTRNNAFTNISTHGNVLGAGKDSSGALVYAHPNASSVDQKPSMFTRNVRDIGKMPIDIFKQSNMYDHITPAMLEERIKNGMSSKDKSDVRVALSTNLGISSTDIPEETALGKNNPWVKWANGNSNYAAQFFS